MHHKINFFITEQYGYSAGYPFYVKYLKQHNHEVSVYHRDQNLKSYPLEKDLNIFTIPVKTQSTIFLLLSYLFSLIKIVRKKKEEVLIFKYSPFIGLITFFIPKSNKVFLDIRTGAINKSKIRKNLLNVLLRIDSLLFRRKFILSDHLAKELKIKNYTLLPLGADDLSSHSKKYNLLKILYIGTLNKREIHKTVEGCSIFLKKHPNIPLEYNIIGYGDDETEKQLKESIRNYRLNDYIKYLGRKNYSELPQYLEESTIGISFVPIEDYYQNQPPTKTYEYIISGLVCIATNTNANKTLINNSNGVLIDDNPHDFSMALHHIYTNSCNFETSKVKQSLEEFQWKNIVKNIIIKSINNA